MPRFVRNFWMELVPEKIMGGFDLSIKMRNNGEIETPIRIAGIADENGNLELIVWNGDNGEVLTRIKTTR